MTNIFPSDSRVVPVSLTNVVMQQPKFIALLAQLNSQQITNGKHAHPFLAINHRQVTSPNLLHSLERLMRSFIASNYRPQRTRDGAQRDLRRILPGHDDAIQNVALRENANQFAFLVEHADGADPSLRHELGCFKHTGGCAQRIWLAIADDISNEHRPGLLLINCSGSTALYEKSGAVSLVLSLEFGN